MQKKRNKVAVKPAFRTIPQYELTWTCPTYPRRHKRVSALC